MAKTLEKWLEDDVTPFRGKPLSWLSQHHFFRDPSRPTYSDLGYFFAPADGVILYQETAGPDQAILNLKGRGYSLREAMRDQTFDKTCLVIAVFMTFFDVHVNRIPYPGRLSYRSLDPIDTHNHPMLDVEKAILEELRVSTEQADYTIHNQRVINRVDSIELKGPYYVLQIADYDVDCITPFELKQHQPRGQGERFSMIRYGSQVDLIIPLSEHYEVATVQKTGVHVEAGVDPVAVLTPPSRHDA